MMQPFQLLLFSTDTALVRRAVQAGLDGVIVDWEWIGKTQRQTGADTQINCNTLEDLEHVRQATSATVICRVNQSGPTTESELESAIRAGVDEILLPMVRTPIEVERAIDRVRGRCGVGILIETMPALRCLDRLSSLPLTRVYVGLNDLAIERQTANIFTALVDGTVETIRQAFQVPFGVAGLTLPDRGYPIPSQLLVGEMARLDAGFSFLRRSFLADIRGRDLMVELPRMLHAMDTARLRSSEVVTQERTMLCRMVNEWQPVGTELANNPVGAWQAAS